MLRSVPESAFGTLDLCHVLYWCCPTLVHQSLHPCLASSQIALLEVEHLSQLMYPGLLLYWNTYSFLGAPTAFTALDSHIVRLICYLKYFAMRAKFFCMSLSFRACSGSLSSSEADSDGDVIGLAITLPLVLKVFEAVATSANGLAFLAILSARSSLTSFWYCFRMSKSLWYETSSNLCCSFIIVTNVDHSG
ncbi:hypothetical protein Tco_0652819 [Tanacetum coccineum]|uniref:Uncharacterized protein n=1 Tax=Tanacetum coccineum TaxID=301880 RepID=A0ABQ4WYU1_9ASTR